MLTLADLGVAPPPWTDRDVSFRAAYFIRCDTTGRIKIGYATDVRARFFSIQCGNSTPVTMLAAIPDHGDVEHLVHAHFIGAHSHGEWFHSTPELLAFVASLPPFPADVLQRINNLKTRPLLKNHVKRSAA